MKLGISTACFYPRYIEDSIERIAQLGFQNIEIFVNSESEFKDSYIKSLASMLKNYGIDVISIHPFTSAMEGLFLFSEYERRTQDSLDQYERYFAAAESLGARYFTFHGERTLPVAGSGKSSTGRRIEVYERLCDRAEPHGIIVAQENVAWCRSSDPAFLGMLADHVSRLGFTLDIKQAHRAGRSWSEYTDVIGKRISNIHINDFDQDHSCLLPGEGEMLFDDFFDTMHGMDYDGGILIEVYSGDFESGEQIMQSAEFLKQYI